MATAPSPSREGNAISLADSAATTPAPDDAVPIEQVLTQNMILQIISDEIISSWEESGKDQL